MRVLLAIISIMLISSTSALAQWTALPGPNGGVIQSMTEGADGTLYAAQYAGAMHRSTNNGLSWEVAAAETWTEGVYLLKTGPDGTMYAGRHDGLYRSANGQNWEATALNDAVTTITFTSSGDVVVGGVGRVHISSNQGDSWLYVIPIIASTRMFKVTVTGNGTWLAGAYQEGIMRSTNDGASWEHADAGLPNLEVYSMTTIDGNIVFAGLNATTYRSTDNGSTWAEAEGLRGENTYAVHRISATRLGAETTGGLFVSDDDGLNWTRIAENAIRRNFGTFLVSSDGTMFAASDGMLQRSTDGGSTWLRGDAGLHVPAISAITVAGEEKYFAGSLYSGLYRSDDAGKNWSTADSVYLPFAVDFVVTHADEIYVVTYDAGLQRSTDDGQSWAIIPDPSENNISAMAYTARGLLAADYQGTVFVSTDKGTSWQPLSTLQPLSGSVTRVIFAMGENATSEIFAGTDRGMFRSSDGGQTWVLTLVSGIHRDVNALHVSAAGVLYASTFRDLFRSTDSGATWTRDYRSPTSTLLNTIATNSVGTVYIVDADGMHYKNDGETNWETLELPGELFTFTMDRQDFLLLGTRYRGMFRSYYTTVGTGILPESVTALHISSIWPQPLRAGSTAMVKVSTRAAAQLSITIADALGRTMYIAERSVDGGAHALRLPVAGLVPGTYVLRVAGNGQSVSRRFVVVR